MSLPLMTTNTATPTPLRELMDRIGGEMNDIAGAMHRIQSLVGLLLRADAFNDNANLREIQSLDLVAQKIECLGEFLSNLSQDLPAGWEVDAHEAAQVITLADLSAKLLGTGAPDAEPLSSGDFEAF